MRPCFRIGLVILFFVVLVFALRSSARQAAQPPKPAPPAFRPGKQPPPADPEAPVKPVDPVAPVKPIDPVPPQGPLAPPAPPAAPQPERQPPSSDRAWTVSGYGQKENDAEQIALDNARASVEDYLNRKFPNLGWSPTTADLARFGIVRVDKPKEKQFDNLPPGYEAIAHIDVSDANLRKMQVEVDEAREKALEPVVWQRHKLVGFVLAAFVALFLVIAGYLRLEELTRGYYTTLLRLTAGAVVALTVVGLFLMF